MTTDRRHFQVREARLDKPADRLVPEIMEAKVPQGGFDFDVSPNR
jgi:hypothetical protein